MKKATTAPIESKGLDELIENLVAKTGMTQEELSVKLGYGTRRLADAKAEQTTKGVPYRLMLKLKNYEEELDRGVIKMSVEEGKLNQETQELLIFLKAAVTVLFEKVAEMQIIAGQPGELERKRKGLEGETEALAERLRASARS